MKNYARKIDYYCGLVADAKINNPSKVGFYLDKLEFFIGRQKAALQEELTLLVSWEHEQYEKSVK